MTVVVALLMFLGATTLALVVPLSVYEYWFLLVMAVVLVMYWSCVERKQAPLILVMVLACAVGFLRVEMIEVPDLTPLVSMSGQTVERVGVVVTDPETRSRGQRFVIEDDETKIRVVVSTLSARAVAYGDQVRVRGRLDEPEDFAGAAGRTFRYQAYLKKDDIYFTMSFAESTVIERGQGNSIKSVLFLVKHAFLDSLQTQIREPEVALAAGILLGVKESLGEELTGDFQTTGVIHIVVLSGFNITIIALFVRGLFERMRMQYAWPASAILIVLFVIMVGAGTTVVRAAVMGLLAALALATNRTYAVTRALLVAAAIMVVWNPLILMDDPSFQLSFVATLGLILVAPLIDPYLSWVPKWAELRMIAAATLSTQLTVLPLLLYHIGELSFVSVPANLLVLIAVPWAMLASFLAGLVGLVSVTLATPLAWIAHGLLAYMITVVEWWANLPLASVIVPAFPVWVMLSVYMVMGVVWLTVTKRAGAKGARASSFQT